MSRRILLDENLPQALRFQLTGHTVVTSAYLGWAGKLNGELVALAEAAAFDVMVTADQNLSYQQNMQGRKLALVVLSTPNKACVLASVAILSSALHEAEPGSYTFIDIGY